MSAAMGTGMRWKIDERACRPFRGSMQSLRHDGVYVGDSRWDATLGRRWRHSLGLGRDGHSVVHSLGCDRVQGDVWELTVIRIQNGMGGMIHWSAIGCR